VHREYFKPRAVRLEEAALTVGPGASFYSLALGAGPIGYASSAVDTTPEGLRVRSLMVVDVEALGKVQRTQITTSTHLTRDLQLKDFVTTLDAPGGAYRVQGVVDRDTVLNISVEAGAEPPQTMRLGFRQAVVLQSVLPLQLAFAHRLAPGNAYMVRVLDPRFMEERDVAVRILAESTLVVPDSATFDTAANRWVPAHEDTLQAFNVTEVSNEVTTESWIDRQGRVVSQLLPTGFRSERQPFEMAVENWRRGAATRVAAGQGASGNVVAATALAAGMPLAPEPLSELEVALGDLPAGVELSGDVQTLTNDTLEVRRETGVGDLPGPQPPLYASKLPVLDAALAPDLQPAPLMQAGDPRIQAQARQIIGRERRAGPVARLLEQWVHERVKPEVAAGVPSAVRVLDDLRGDCNEHTVLYVALARAVGLPARTAAGLVYLRGRFYYHAWPEVWLGRWVAVDPTFGQFPADASHLRFVIGGLARQVELLRLIGRLTVTVVGSQSQPK